VTNGSSTLKSGGGHGNTTIEYITIEGTELQRGSIEEYGRNLEGLGIDADYMTELLCEQEKAIKDLKTGSSVLFNLKFTEEKWSERGNGRKSGF
jgi:hypothetical protein